MSILKANADGTSNAKVGDYVVTGGGVFYKDKSGTVKVSDLKNYIGSSATSSYDDVQKAYDKVKSTVVGGTRPTESNTKISQKQDYSQPTAKVAGVDANGIVDVAVDGYNPNDYVVSSSGGSSAGTSKVVGVVILGLISIALLDKFMSSGK